MNLNITWEGPQGPNIHYVVEYRPYPSSEPFITFDNDVHTNYAVIPDLPDGFYEVRILQLCGGELQIVLSKVGGKPSCADPVFDNFSILGDTPTSQILRINMSSFNSAIRVRVTRINTNSIYREETVGTSGSYDIVLNKSATEAYTYKVEIANECIAGLSNFVDMGSYTVQQIPQGVAISYVSTETCALQPTINFTDKATSVLYTNPEALPKAIYDLVVTVPKGTCSGLGTVTIKGFSEFEEIFSSSIEVEPDDVKYVVPFNDLNLITGIEAGSFITLFTITFTQ